MGEKLDLLLPYGALWKAWFMGIHLPSLRCPEELAYSISEIYHAWQSLTCQTPDILDPKTLSLLEGRCPSLSTTDQWHIQQIFLDGRAFPEVTSSDRRSQLQHAALSYNKVIPSLRIFLENTNHLRAMTDVMKKILPLKFKGTMRETMLKYYQEPTGTQHQIQRSENDFDQEQGSKEYGFWMAYRQLFLFAMRHFFGLTNVRPLALSSHRSKFETSELWRRFKSCARAIGFVLPGSNWPKDRNQGPFPSGYTLECAAIHQLITRLRPPELFSCDQAKFSETSGQIISLLSTITARKLSNIITPQTCEMIETWSVERRCGMPTADTFFHDQKYLFMHYIDATNQPAGVGMSSFAVKRDIFRSFFADFDDGSRMDETMAPVTMVSISEPLRDIPVSLELQQNLELKFR